ncbi:putative membrane protein (TIGR02234 family) [Arthrobacter pigmenti]|uniref:Putative membrane protein (TIGR02234 family) n=1 Tax=Arthrobacter pigmenti TaxID=271432 RepID=A0A846RT67_9MICC|nr:Trp biosynthesis-associated membrane protein [Arthrobacter pigmenti]NJC22266.1 putative membrane protein (TIGR02234 family) [Arthrobacter pigmenti]
MTQESPAPAVAPLRRRKGIVVLATVVAALAAFGSTTQTWLSVLLPQDAVQTPSIQVPGSDAATAVTAFALVGLAAALAASIAGTVARWIITLILMVAGAGIAWSSFAVILDPAPAAAPAIGDALGVSAPQGVSVAITPMPWVAVVAGILLIICALWILGAGRRWSAARRYEKSVRIKPATETNSNADEIDSWDSLSRGDDPTR